MFSNEFSPIECGKIRSDLLLITFPVSQSSASLVHAFDNGETLTIVTIVRILHQSMGSDMGQRLENMDDNRHQSENIVGPFETFTENGGLRINDCRRFCGHGIHIITSPYFGLAIIVTPQYNSDIKPFRTLTLVW